MQDIKALVDSGQVELARMDSRQQPVAIQYEQLEQQRDRLDRFGTLYASLRAKTSQQRQDWVREQKNIGNQLFRAQEYQRATAAYLDGLVGIDLQDQQMVLELKYPILLNMSTCFYNLGLHNKGLELCKKILAEPLGHKHPLALFKQAHFLLQLGNFEQASQTLHELTVLREHGKGGSVGKEDIQQAIDLLRKRKTAEKDVYRKMFVEKDDGDDDGDGDGVELVKEVGVGMERREAVESLLGTAWEWVSRCCTGCWYIFEQKMGR